MLQWITSRVLERVLDLPDPITRDITVHRDVRVPMPDGVQLLADHWMPTVQDGGPPPTVLVRCPYGRRNVWGALYGRPLAERGFQVLLQSVRGTFGSGGRFEPYRNERPDGLATARWIREQPWFNGTLASTGISYLGFTQWAIADDAGLAALCLQATASDFGYRTYDGGAFSLRTALSWTRTLLTQERRRLPSFGADSRLEAGLGHLPLNEADRVGVGATVSWYQDWLTMTPASEFWRSVSNTARIGALSGPVTMRAGWYDIFLPWQIRDFAALTQAGAAPELTIGPWAHSSLGMIRGISRDTVEFLGQHLLGRPKTRSPVRYFVTGSGVGAGQWRDSPTWPPAGVRTQDWVLMPGGELIPQGDPGPDGGATRFRYDPANPTPAVGGPRLDGKDSVIDNRDLEARDDVLVFTSAVLDAPVELTGTPVALVCASADRPWHDLFVRLCDVDPGGVSKNVADRLIRLDPGTDLPPGFSVAGQGDDVQLASFELWPVAHRFAAGHRIRVQVSGGAHPRFARNPGTGEPLGSALRLVPSTIAIHHDARLRSRLVLPIHD